MGSLRIDAWLEREEPIIKLHSGMSDALIAEWRGNTVTELIEQGIVTCSEMFSTDRKVQQQAAHELLLNACANSGRACTAPAHCTRISPSPSWRQRISATTCEKFQAPLR